MNLKKISVLAVEDDKFIARAYREKFENEGFTSRFAYDGIQAINFLKKSVPDVIVLDILLPKSDGYAFLKKIQKNKKWANIPIIMATNLDEEKDIRTAAVLGAKEYVVKSRLSLTDLVNRINEIKNELEN